MAIRVSQESYRISPIQYGLRSGKSPRMPKLKITALQAGKNFGPAGCEFFEAGVQSELFEYPSFDAEPRHAMSRGAKARGHPRKSPGGVGEFDYASLGKRTKRRGCPPVVISRLRV